MKYNVTFFKNLSVGLKELERFVRDGLHLSSGKPFAQLGGMRSREALANWLLCVATNDATGEDRLIFTSDPDGRADGIILDKSTGDAVLTEHTYIPSPRVGVPANQVQEHILEAIEKKVNKGGAAYASGKTLVVFSDSIGEWFPNKIARQLPDPLYFDMVWVVALQGVQDGEYIYNIARLDLSQGNAPVWRVIISKNFSDWRVEGVQ